MMSITDNPGHNRIGLLVLVSSFILFALYVWWSENKQPLPWSSEELAILESLWIKSLPPLPPDYSNSVADSLVAAKLGQEIFFDTRFSAFGQVSCATCHQPQLHFTDGLNKAFAIGQTARHTPSIVGTAYSPWLYWDGRKDSQWSQALAPMEDLNEHGGNRMQFVRLMSTDEHYRKEYINLFGEIPDFSDTTLFHINAGPVPNPEWNTAWEMMTESNQHLVNQVFSNIGKAIAAYERRLIPGASRFDTYVTSLLRGENNYRRSLFSPDEIKGLRLFIGEARCIECHNGPLFTNNEFHNTGLLPSPGELPDQGRSRIVEELLADPFNCIGPYSDASVGRCTELTYMRTDRIELIGAMRTPSLRNIGRTAPYMHKGQLPNLTEVLEHYNQAKLALIGHNEAEPLGLNKKQLQQIELFLNTLDAPIAGSQEWGQSPF